MTDEMKNNETQKPEQHAADQQAEEIFVENEQKPMAEDSSNIVPELEKKLEEAENRTLRLQADFDNYRRRVRLDAEAAEKYRAQSLISDLLPVLDNFERALAVEIEGEQAQSFKQGMDMVYRGLLEALKKEGLEPIEAKGKPFDPNFHQAVMQVEDNSMEPNSVVEEFQKGYVLKHRVIRPSMVKVNQ
ncbi:nucleotide exchange factor GrpE [Bacillus sp. FJAT-27225]|uniref:nucleotide exchange factor GrpE n=1 Tax=Bacillus sp. FJAT-27225 TaxID=1743144 RepID=UPI00080C2A25|nr:nucleotide exchange factor GrpE [Bacillus sp. FJAT-27225]OCA91163.1 nucleotide exchange factor GrpE [Bacillus sp. FJAT-27225]